MSDDDLTLVDANYAVVTPIQGPMRQKSSSEYTLSEDPTLLWGGAIAKGPEKVGATVSALRPRSLRLHSHLEASRKGFRRGRSRFQFPPTGLVGALAWGAVLGLAVSATTVGLLRASSADHGASRVRGTVDVIVRTMTEAGRPVAGARVSVGEMNGETDSQGNYKAEHRRGVSPSLTDEVVVRVECPKGHLARDSSRVVRWMGGKSTAEGAEDRELTFYCEVEQVDLTLDLRVLRGEARFRLGELDLGLSQGGRLRRDVLVPAYADQVLTAEPELGRKQTPPERVVGASRVVQVGEKSGTLEHTVELVWPQVKSGRQKAAPYRL